jgi:hypothetical protein
MRRDVRLLGKSVGEPDSDHRISQVRINGDLYPLCEASVASPLHTSPAHP